MSERAKSAARYVQKRFSENPDYRPRHTTNFSPKRWTDEALTETWAERKARLAAERGK